jgi:hypothetical protein
MISDARGGHVSPGIYTEERDVTYSVKSLGITSLGLVGETLYGPAFENIEIGSWSEFIDYFGGTSAEKFRKTGTPKYELPYIAKSYLEESRRLNVVRVLGLSGYNAGRCWVIYQGEKAIVILRSNMTHNSSSNMCEAQNDGPTPIVTNISLGDYKEKTYDSVCVENESSATTSSSSATTKPGFFSLTVTCGENDKGYADSYTFNVCLDSQHSNYIYNVISSRPNESTPIYVESVYENSFNSAGTLDITSSDDFNDYKESYRAAETPWIVSEALISDGESGKKCTMKKLFRFITISDGDNANTQVKVSIVNIRPKEGTFDVIVRDFYDTDTNPLILERFTKCNLIEGDSNYIAYKIGTSDGGYVVKSKYILVEMADNVDLGRSVPAGFLGYPCPNYTQADILDFNMGYNTLYKVDTKAKKQYFGCSDKTDIDILKYKGREAYGENASYTKGFHLDSQVSESASENYVDGVSGYGFDVVSPNKVGNEVKPPRIINADYLNYTIYKDVNTCKFTVFFYGGFDGWDITREERTNTDDYKSTKYNISGSSVFERCSFDSNEYSKPISTPSTAITSDYYAYLAGYRVFANPQDVDINLFATPGIDWMNNSLLTEEAINIIEDSDEGRGGDALYIMASPNVEANYVDLSEDFKEKEFNTSYACTYYPWVMYYDNSNKKYLTLPVTKDVVRNMAATDNNSYPWFAPAGMERGNVKCVKATYKTTLGDEDVLYNACINPVKTFAQDGVKIWGNKTAYDVDSPLNRINVRRLMIRVKKLVNNAAKHLIFTQYDDSIEQQFKGLIEPILADVKSNRGISDYRIITEVTPETKDQHILPAKILIKPTPALEYISISFVVYPESVSFDEN